MSSRHPGRLYGERTSGGTGKWFSTSSGITDESIREALLELLGKPISESSALAIPSGVEPFPGGPQHVHRFLSVPGSRMCGLGGSPWECWS